MDLTTRYLTLTLDSPLVASACPLTGNVESLKRLRAAGAAAAVLPSIFEEQIENDEMEIARLLDFWALSTPETNGYFPEMDSYNTGPDEYLDLIADAKRELDMPIIASLNGSTLGGWLRYAGLIEQAGADALEINISCPNVEHGHAEFAGDPSATFTVVDAVRKATSKPILPKLSPNVTDIRVFARACEEAGADAVSLINTLVGTAIDIRTRRFRLANVTGGLSGPCIKPVALRMVYQTAQAVRIPVVGIGGIVTAEDAVEFLLAGATAVQVGTGNFVNPMAAPEIVEGIKGYLAERGLNSPSDIIGKVEKAI